MPGICYPSMFVDEKKEMGRRKGRREGGSEMRHSGKILKLSALMKKESKILSYVTYVKDEPKRHEE